MVTWYTSDDQELRNALDAEIAEQKDRTGPYLYMLTLAHAGAPVLRAGSVLVMILMALQGAIQRR
jgi:hypothetical protein